MKTCLLSTIFCILLCTVRGKADKAQKLLKTLDLEEVLEKLEEFDVNQDGQLSEMEVELQQPGIQKYLDRYEELLKAEEDEKDDEEEKADKKKDPKPNQKTVQSEKTENHQKTDTQQTSTQQQENNVQGDPTKQQKETVTPSAASPNQQNKQEDQKQQIPGNSAKPPAVEDEDDGVEIEVVEDLEFVDDNETQNYSNVPLSALVLAVVLGIPTVLYIVCSKARADWHAKQQQKEEKMVQQREAWLNRMASSQQKKEPENNKTTPQSRSPPPASSEHKKKDSAVTPLTDKLATKLAISPQPGSDQCKSGSSASADKKLNDKSDTDSKDEVGECSSKVATTTKPSPGVPKTTADGKESGDSKKNGPLSRSAVPEPAPSPAEKTTDVEKLKGFLEKAFDCELTLTDQILKMRFSGGRMRIPTGQFPTTVEDVESKMKDLVTHAFKKHFNRVRFSIRAYSVCESSGSAFHDSLVDSTIAIIQRVAVNEILSYFEAGMRIKRDTDASEGGLWDDSDEDSKVTLHRYESSDFFHRLVGSSKDGVNVSPAMLAELLSDEEKSHHMVLSLLKNGGEQINLTDRFDEIMLRQMAILQGLELLIADANFPSHLSKLLNREIDRALMFRMGVYFQMSCALSGLLRLSTIPDKTMTGFPTFKPAPSAAKPFRSLRTFPKMSPDEVDTAQIMIQKGMKAVKQLVYSAMRRVVSNKSMREVSLTWLATLISGNEARTSTVSGDTEDHICCSDAFMLNVCSLLLEFYLPIGQNMEKLEKVDLGYSVSPACRLAYSFETCLADGQIAPSKEQTPKRGMLPAALQGQHSFITECFHLTQRALSVSVIPAIKRYDSMHGYFLKKLELVKGTDKAKEEEISNKHVLSSVVWETSFLDTDLVIGITTFYISQAKLLLKTVHSLAEKHQSVEEGEAAQRKALSVVPEFCIKDMAQWFSFLADTVLRVKPNVTKGIPLTPFVDCCVMLLERPDLMPGPVPASMIVTALLTFMKESDNSHKLGLRGSWGSSVLSELAAMVHTCPSAQTKLGPALLRTYVSVDVVEGLDVDKDNFDKFITRVQIGQLVQKLWSRSDCRGSIIDQCGTDMFRCFLDSILDTLLYKLHDSLGRLANVKKIETLKANEAEWNALSRQQQMEKQNFLLGEEQVGSGFMRQAKKTLKFLNLLSQSERVTRCFTQQPLATRAASTINGFLDALCGAKAKNLKVKDMAKYGFNPVELLVDIMTVILRITMEDVSRTDGYLVSMVKDPDFELAHLEKAESVIVGKGFVSEDTTGKIAQLMEQVRQLAAEHCPVSPPSGGEDEGSWRDAFVDLDIDRQSLEKEYASVMEGQRFSCARILQSHCFQNNLQGAFDPRSPKVKVIMKEMKQLSTSLPVNVGASIFVRQDKDRMDVMRALVTGPSGTPYSLGCFCFDIYFPAAYPNVPPLVKIITTGNGTVRFNPNLYADGKVCLSLLGTWHAGTTSEKWTPGTSSLYQVMVSIQSMILTADPVFNEPGYERIKGSEEGKVQSRQYNWKIHLQTLRHAVLGQLRNPHPGFERVIRQHFALQREAVFKQCAEWVKGCEDPDVLKRLRKVADSIFEEFMKLDVDFNEAEEDSEEEEEEDDD